MQAQLAGYSTRGREALAWLGFIAVVAIGVLLTGPVAALVAAVGIEVAFVMWGIQASGLRRWVLVTVGSVVVVVPLVWLLDWTLGSAVMVVG
ncbi:MAG: hypothetical protein IPL43_02130 [Micropruina sp.]|nr:hypothetical protein [Micropruina sp.]